MNPSTEKITEAVMATPAKTVYVFPNNKNIIMSAQQSVDLIKDRTVIIVPTKTIPQGAAADAAAGALDLDGVRGGENAVNPLNINLLMSVILRIL